MNEDLVDDLFPYVVLFMVVLLVCVLLAVLVRRADRAFRARWGPDEVVPTREERMLTAVRQLQSAGVDVPGLLGEWSPAPRHGPDADESLARSAGFHG